MMSVQEHDRVVRYGARPVVARPDGAAERFPSTRQASPAAAPGASPGRRVLHGPRRSLLAALFVALGLVFATAAAQDLCMDELQGAVARDAPPVRVATALARTALEVIEPALPTDRGASAEWEDPNAAWLQRRGYLPNGWDEDAELTAERWAALLANLQTPFHVEPRAPSGSTDPQTLLSEAAQALQGVASAVRPLALVATVPGDRQSVAFAGVIWNWTLYPRLLIFDPSDLAFGEGEDGIDNVLAGMGTCAWRPRAYLATDADTAADYYLGNTEATMRLLAVDDRHVGEVVPEGQERAALAFGTDALQGADVASLGFEGPGPSVGRLAGLLVSVRTNVGAFDLQHFLAFP